MKSGSKILLIDDNADFRLLLRLLLQDHGYIVYEAEDGAAGLAMYEQEHPHMAIVDLNTPKMNGIEFSKQIKAKEPAFPILMITGYAPFVSPTDLLSAGANEFLQKPVDVKSVMEVVERM